MSKIFSKKVINVEKLEELDDGFDAVRITFDDGETVEAAAKFIFKDDEL